MPHSVWWLTSSFPSTDWLSSLLVIFEIVYNPARRVQREIAAHSSVPRRLIMFLALVAPIMLLEIKSASSQLVCPYCNPNYGEEPPSPPSVWPSHFSWHPRAARGQQRLRHPQRQPSPRQGLLRPRWVEWWEPQWHNDIMTSLPTPSCSPLWPTLLMTMSGIRKQIFRPMARNGDGHYELDGSFVTGK